MEGRQHNAPESGLLVHNWQVVTDGPADGAAVLLPRVTEAEFKAKVLGLLAFLQVFCA